MTVTTNLNVEEYLARDFPPPTQLVDGEVVVNQPSFRHQRIALFILGELVSWTRAGEHRGEAGFGCDWVYGERNVFVPDVWWLREDRRPGRDAVRMYEFPDLAVEVRSASTWRYDIGPKRARYEEGGVLELWLVDTDSDTVIVNRRSKPDASGFDELLELRAGDTLTSVVFPGLAFDIGEIFDR